MLIRSSAALIPLINDMSLKAFHIVFIFLSVLLAAGCAWWAFANGAGFGFGIGCSLVALSLIVYGAYFLRKARKLIL